MIKIYKSPLVRWKTLTDWIL